MENPDESLELKIREIFEYNKERYGYRRITMELQAQGYNINHKKVLRLMRKLKLKCVKFGNKSRKYNSYRRNVGNQVDNKINQRFNTIIPRQKITTDTSEFKYYLIDAKGNLNIGKLYLDPFMDMYNGEIISYSINKQPIAKSILEAQIEAIKICIDECPYRTTFHSDGGWAYKMQQYKKSLKNNGIFQSMSRKATSTDNSPMENFFSILKQEMYYGEKYYSYDELKNAIEEYIEYYNNKRRKKKLNGLSPVNYLKKNQEEVADYNIT